MTREEASKIIKDGIEDMSLDYFDEEQYEALEMAIKALEQKPSGDLISRQAVYEVLDSMLDDSSDNKRNQLVSLDSIADEIAEIPSVKQEPSVVFVKTEESNDNGTKYLNINVSDGEVKRNPDVVRLCSDVGILEYAKSSGDLISRQAAIKHLTKARMLGDSRPMTEIFAELPPVNPQEPKTGHWIKSNIPDDEGYVCSECGGGCWYYDYQANVVKSRFCPNCGCRMVEPQESEEQE